MKKLPLPFIVAALAILAGFSAFIIWGIPYFFRPFSFVSGAEGYG